MFTNEMHDRFNPGTDLTAIAQTAVTGKTFVKIAGAMSRGNIVIAPASAGGAVAGVAKYDAAASELVGVARGSSRVVTVTAGADITAGSDIEVGANGSAIPSVTGRVVGMAVDNAATGADVLISLAN